MFIYKHIYVYTHIYTYIIAQVHEHVWYLSFTFDMTYTSKYFNFKMICNKFDKIVYSLNLYKIYAHTHTHGYVMHKYTSDVGCILSVFVKY